MASDKTYAVAGSGNRSGRCRSWGSVEPDGELRLQIWDRYLSMQVVGNKSKVDDGSPRLTEPREDIHARF